MKDRILRFLTELDTALVAVAAGERLDLYHIGRSAVAWQYGIAELTDDMDVIQPAGGTTPLMAEALRLFGKGTANARAHDLYLEVVPAGLPPVPPGCRNRATEYPGGWAVVRLFHLDPHDLAATKLKRFAGKDRQDIRWLCDLDLLDPDVLHARLRTAWHSEKDEDDGDHEQTRAFTNLRTVQKYLRNEIDAF